jgi:hypothetical protein
VAPVDLSQHEDNVGMLEADLERAHLLEARQGNRGPFTRAIDPVDAVYSDGPEILPASRHAEEGDRRVRLIVRLYRSPF